MSRTGLSVALRLARIDERRALSQLGAARARTVALEDRLAVLDTLRAEARNGMAPGTGSLIAAEVLQQHGARLASAQLLIHGVNAKLGEARGAEEATRAALAQRRLRVRVVSNALSRREARERLHARRRESQRIDEAARASRAQTEAGDALA